MQIIVLQSQQLQLNEAIMNLLDKLGHEATLLDVTEVDVLFAQYPDGGSIVSPDVLIDLRVGSASSDICTPFYSKQPTGLVVHIQGGSMVGGHANQYLAKPVVHCLISTATWEADLPELLMGYEQQFCRSRFINHDQDPSPW